MMTDDFRNKQCVFNMNVGFQGFQTWCKSFCANTRKIAHISGGNVYGIYDNKCRALYFRNKK